METPATRADWKTLPLPDRHSEVMVDGEIPYATEEWERIRMGLLPEEMEDRWFIFTEDDRVFFHRNWTGYCIFVAEFAEHAGRRVLRRLLINRDPAQYTAVDDESDVRYVERLIGLLLERPGRGPERSG